MQTASSKSTNDHHYPANMTSPPRKASSSASGNDTRRIPSSDIIPIPQSIPMDDPISGIAEIDGLLLELETRPNNDSPEAQQLVKDCLLAQREAIYKKLMLDSAPNAQVPSTTLPAPSLASASAISILPKPADNLPRGYKDESAAMLDMLDHIQATAERTLQVIQDGPDLGEAMHVAPTREQATSRNDEMNEFLTQLRQAMSELTAMASVPG